MVDRPVRDERGLRVFPALGETGASGSGWRLVTGFWFLCPWRGGKSRLMMAGGVGAAQGDCRASRWLVFPCLRATVILFVRSPNKTLYAAKS
ncbi:hypothetical protein D3877_25160 [Azospirillum cavernae]|uniref:Uncharacterized protein n=1 Tax=Azospirillum cavernae TaxID=2320860 RepID=A0A418VQ40_9PROT|nr:hypothetical protein D3877_25160 [Azospirillum cavernae]